MVGEHVDQVRLAWDNLYRPKCSECGERMRGNRKTLQVAADVPLGSVSAVFVSYESVQGFCRSCESYRTVRPLAIVEHHPPRCG